MSNVPNQNQFKATNDGEGEVYVPLTKNLTNMDLYDVNIKRIVFTYTVKLWKIYTIYKFQNFPLCYSTFFYYSDFIGFERFPLSVSDSYINVSNCFKAIFK